MNKKIDFFNKDNKDDLEKKDKNSSHMGSKKSGSKTANPNKPKRRGRRPKKILEHVDNSDNSSDSQNNETNNSAVILKLDSSKLENFKELMNESNNKRKPKKTKKIPKEEKEDENDVSSEGMFKNDIPGDTACNKCAKNEKTIALLKSKLDKYEKKEKIDKSNKVYNNKLNFISLTTGKKVVIKKTNIKCWWDAHNFTNLPCFLPELYHNGTYHVTGCFCSFNCALAYNLYYLKDSKIHQRKSLIYKLYREMYEIGPDEIIEIKEAPPKEILDDFGGNMTIDVFRRRFIMVHKEYIVFIPPIKPINIMIEERNVNDDNDLNDKKYVLKRSKPLAKKRSVINFVNKKVEEDDE